MKILLASNLRQDKNQNQYLDAIGARTETMSEKIFAVITPIMTDSLTTTFAVLHWFIMMSFNRWALTCAVSQSERPIQTARRSSITLFTQF